MFKTDAALEQSKGIVLDFEDFRVTVLRAGGSNRQFETSLDAHSKKFRRAIQTETISNDKSREILRNTYVDSVITNWEVPDERDAKGKVISWKQGIENPETGEIMPFSKSNVMMVLEMLPDLFEAIQDSAAKQALFRTSIKEIEQGN